LAVIIGSSGLEVTVAGEVMVIVLGHPQFTLLEPLKSYGESPFLVAGLSWSNLKNYQGRYRGKVVYPPA